LLILLLRCAIVDPILPAQLLRFPPGNRQISRPENMTPKLPAIAERMRRRFRARIFRRRSGTTWPPGSKDPRSRRIGAAWKSAIIVAAVRTCEPVVRLNDRRACASVWWDFIRRGHDTIAARAVAKMDPW